MKQLYNYISEAAKPSGKWAAIYITTKGADSWSKSTSSERVVSWETYCDMKQNGRTKGYMDIEHLELLGTASSKEEAMNYLTPKDKTARKSKIKAGNAEYIVWCISSGKFTASGKTTWDWNIWDNAQDTETDDSDMSQMELYYGTVYGKGSILFGAKGSLSEGDTLCCVDNDSEKKLTGAPTKIEFVCDCTLDEFREAFRKKYPEKCKRPSFQFGKRSDGLPWSKMGQMYSIKGVIDTEKYNKQ